MDFAVDYRHQLMCIHVRDIFLQKPQHMPQNESIQILEKFVMN